MTDYIYMPAAVKGLMINVIVTLSMFLEKTLETGQAKS